MFGLQNLSPDSDELIVVEDEVDALVIRQKTGRNVIAVSRLKGMMIPQQVRTTAQLRLWLHLYHFKCNFSVPHQVLPSLERFTKIIFFASSKSENVTGYARKLGEKRCFVVNK